MDNIKQVKSLLTGIIGESKSVMDTIKDEYLNESYNLPLWSGDELFNDLLFIPVLKEDFSNTLNIDKTTAEIVCRKTDTLLENVCNNIKQMSNSDEVNILELAITEDTLPIVETHIGNEPVSVYVIPSESLHLYINEHAAMNVDYCVQQLLEYHNIEPTNTYILLPSEIIIENSEDIEEIKKFNTILQECLFLKKALDINLCTD